MDILIIGFINPITKVAVDIIPVLFRKGESVINEYHKGLLFAYQNNLLEFIKIEVNDN